MKLLRGVNGMLQVKNLTKFYRKTLAVNQINFSVEQGKVAILLGSNGAGKSTAIKSIVGLLRYRGEIFVTGYPARSMEAKKRVAYVPEIPSIYPDLTIKEHIEFIARAYGVEEYEEEMKTLVERFELEDKLNKFGDELSKGMMQKLSICCALITNPEVIILDEPMVGLDPKAINELKKLILEYKEKGKTFLISTHILDLVKEFWDTVFVMQKGAIIGQYNRNETDDNESIEKFYFSLTESEKEV